MAQGPPGSGRKIGSSKANDKPAPVSKPVVDRRMQPPPGSRQSVAAARQTSAGSNRVQLWIGAVAVALIAIVVVVGLVLNRKQNASPVTDHPKSLNSVAGVSDGVITVTVNGPPAALTIDLYEDGICSACQAFEGQYGQQIMKAVDDGKLTVRYHFMNFLNKESASKDYSTRAAAALECVAAVPAADAPKGLFLNFHTTMFTSGTQPAENGSADLSNSDIAALAVKSGAPRSAGTCITSGQNISQATATAKASAARLTALVPGGAYFTPTGVKNDQLLDLNSTTWLTNELA